MLGNHSLNNCLCLVVLAFTQRSLWTNVTCLLTLSESPCNCCLLISRHLTYARSLRHRINCLLLDNTPILCNLRFVYHKSLFQSFVCTQFLIFLCHKIFLLWAKYNDRLIDCGLRKYVIWLCNWWSRVIGGCIIRTSEWRYRLMYLLNLLLAYLRVGVFLLSILKNLFLALLKLSCFYPSHIETRCSWLFKFVKVTYFEFKFNLISTIFSIQCFWDLLW